MPFDLGESPRRPGPPQPTSDDVVLARLMQHQRQDDRQISSSRSAVTQGGVWRGEGDQDSTSNTFDAVLTPGAGLWVVDLTFSLEISGDVSEAWMGFSGAVTSGLHRLYSFSSSSLSFGTTLHFQISDSSATVTATASQVTIDSGTPDFQFAYDAIARRIR